MLRIYRYFGKYEIQYGQIYSFTLYVMMLLGIYMFLYRSYTYILLLSRLEKQSKLRNYLIHYYMP